MIVCRWANVADLNPGDIVASSAPRRGGEHSRVLARLADRLARGGRPGIVTEVERTNLDVELLMRCGRVTLRETYRTNAELAVVSTSETDLDNLAQLRETVTPIATTTGQEANMTTMLSHLNQPNLAAARSLTDGSPGHPEYVRALAELVIATSPNLPLDPDNYRAAIIADLNNQEA